MKIAEIVERKLGHCLKKAKPLEEIENLGIKHVSFTIFNKDLRCYKVSCKYHKHFAFSALKLVSII